MIVSYTAWLLEPWDYGEEDKGLAQREELASLLVQSQRLTAGDVQGTCICMKLESMLCNPLPLVCIGVTQCGSLC